MLASSDDPRDLIAIAQHFVAEHSAINIIYRHDKIETFQAIFPLQKTLHFAPACWAFKKTRGDEKKLGVMIGMRNVVASIVPSMRCFHCSPQEISLRS